jgi:LAO/AO transport system kinase
MLNFLSHVVESTRKDHRIQAQQLLSLILDAQHERAKRTGDFITTFRIGLSGPPGVGKSTFIERFGMHILSQGHRVAVLVCYIIFEFLSLRY